MIYFCSVSLFLKFTWVACDWLHTNNTHTHTHSCIGQGDRHSCKKDSLEIVIEQVRLEGSFKREGRIRVAACLRHNPVMKLLRGSTLSPWRYKVGAESQGRQGLGFGDGLCNTSVTMFSRATGIDLCLAQPSRKIITTCYVLRVWHFSINQTTEHTFPFQLKLWVCFTCTDRSMKIKISDQGFCFKSLLEPTCFNLKLEHDSVLPLSSASKISNIILGKKKCLDRWQIDGKY